jgi:hypothetical protein
MKSAGHRARLRRTASLKRWVSISYSADRSEVRSPCHLKAADLTGQSPNGAANRCRNAASTIGAMAVLVEAKNDAAQAKRLFLPMKTVATLFG